MRLRRQLHRQERWFLAFLLSLFGLLVAAPVAAQDAAEGVKGTLSYNDAEGERVFVEGVVVTVADESGTDVGTATTDASGAFDIDVPAPGSYVVTLDQATLPEGVVPRADGDDTRTIELRANERRGTLFPLVDSGVTVDEGGGFFKQLAELSFDGLKFGMIIAMCSIGLSLIYGTTGLTNFAHGELVAFGALFALMLNNPNVLGMPVIPAGIIAIAATAVAGWSNERLLWRPLRNRGTGLISMLVISIGLSIFVRYIYLFFAGGRRARYSQFALQEGIEIGPLTVVPRELWIIGISAVALVLVATAIQRTRIGKAMRAVADNRDLAESSGIDVERVILTVWVVGGALAGLGGFLFGLDQGVSWDMGFELLLLMFAAVTLGGLGTAYGPLLGSIIIGLLVNISTVQFSGNIGLPAELKNVGALIVLVVILLVRPQGLLGQKERIG